ncbi:MAG TPA: HAD family phosphatase [Firmicutes bacterium]|nr:MAG: hypothetical protein AA931_12265 [Peptococcaceae bacterium 1109]HHT73778.1 HAD family phosphatase [Bacillota bacterium]
MKLIALDLDGTLLNPGGTISKHTRDYLEQLTSSGLWISLVTGRPYDEACALMESNGVPPSSGFPHFLICEERDIYTLTQDGHYEPWEPRNSDLLSAERALLPAANDLAERLAKECGLRFFVNNSVYQEKRGFVELVFPDRDAARDGLEKAAPWAEAMGLKAIRNNQGVAFRYRHIGKLPALQELVECLGAAPQEVLVMGDSHNDLAMLTAGFHSATTANADAEIKTAVLDAGGYVSGQHASDGVADVLQRVFKL